MTVGAGRAVVHVVHSVHASQASAFAKASADKSRIMFLSSINEASYKRQAASQEKKAASCEPRAAC